MQQNFLISGQPGEQLIGGTRNTQTVHIRQFAAMPLHLVGAEQLRAQRCIVGVLMDRTLSAQARRQVAPRFTQIVATQFQLQSSFSAMKS